MSIEGQSPERRESLSGQLGEAIVVCLDIASQSEIDGILEAAANEIRELVGATSAIIEVSGAFGAGRYYSGISSGAESREIAPASEGSPGPPPVVEASIGDGSRVSGSIRLERRFEEGEFTPGDLQAVSVVAGQLSLIMGRTLRIQENILRTVVFPSADRILSAAMLIDANTAEAIAGALSRDQVHAGLGISPGDADESVGMLNCLSEEEERTPLAQFLAQRALSGDGSLLLEEFVLETPEGFPLTVEITSIPILGADGSVSQVLGNVRRISHVGTAGMVRTEFWANISHYLWKLLTTIKGSAATSLGSPIPLDQTDFRHVLRIIDQQADKMRDVLGKLVDLTRIQSRTLLLAPETVRVEELVEQASMQLRESRPALEVRIVSDPDLPASFADRARLVQVLERLIFYSASGSDGNSEVEVRLRAEDTGTLVTVRRQREGLAGRASRQGDDLFSSDLNWESAEIELDITMCRGLVESLGGTWMSDSQATMEGRLFAFSLPVGTQSTDPETTDSTRSASVSRSITRGFPRILVVDSDAQAQVYVQDALSLAGYSTIATSNLEEVHALIDAEVPQLVLLELMLPGDDGLELIGRIARGLDTPVIFLSTRGREAELEQAFQLGGDDFIVKPFLPAELIARVREVLRKRETQNLPNSSQVYSFQDLEINYTERNVMVAGETVKLSATEYRLLFELSISAGRLLTHNQLLRRVWGSEYGGDKRLVRAFIKNLRRKLGDDANTPKYIFTEAGAGYRMARP